MVRSSGVVLARNTLYSIATQIGVSVVAFLSIPILVRGMGEEAFGVLTLVWMVVGYFSILDFGVGQASVKFLAEHISRGEFDDANSTVWTSVATSTAVGLFTSVAIVLFMPVLVNGLIAVPMNLRAEVQQSFYWVTLAIPFVMMQGAFRAVPMAVQRFDMFNLMLGLSGLLQWGGSLALILLGLGLREIVWLTVAIRLGGACLAYIIAVQLFPQLSFRRPMNTKGTMRKLLSFGGWLTISQAAGPVMRYVDRLLVASFCSLRLFTYYVVPYEAVSRILVIPLSLSTTLFPAMAERRSTQGVAEAAMLYKRATNFTVIAVLPASIIVAVFSAPILQLWLGGDFPAISSRVFSVLAIAIFVQSVGYVPVTTLQAIGKPDVAPKFYVVEIPFYIALCFVLIPLLGIEGAAWAWLLRVSVSTGWLLWRTHRNLRMNGFLPFAGTVAPGFLFNGVMLLGLLLIRHLVGSLLVQILLVFAALLLYAVAVWKSCLDVAERNALQKLAHGLLRINS